MRRTLMMVGTSALAVAALAVGGTVLFQPFAATRAEDTVAAKDACETGSVQAAIVRTYANERLLEVKLERMLVAGSPVPGEKQPKCDSPGCRGTLRVGQVFFVDASLCARVLDEKGVEQKRDDKSAWFTKDAGWAILKEGQRVRIDYSGAREIPAPKDFPEGARTGGKLLVYTATLVELLPAAGIAQVTSEAGTAEGPIVRLFTAEKLMELKVETGFVKADEKAPKDKAGPAAGTLILVRLENAIVMDEKSVERKRDDKSAWFSKDDGWSILKTGMRVKIEYSSTQQIPAPADFPKDARAGGFVLVYNATTVQVLADTKLGMK